MSVWEITNDMVNDVAMLVIAREDESPKGMQSFDAHGSPLHWRRRPKVEIHVDKRRKKPKPRADLSPFWPGALVLNERARSALGEFLGAFGQLLELDVAGEVEYFYNCTYLVSCIDRDHSQIRASGIVGKEAFNEAAVPVTPAVFKDPLTARSKLYVNDAGKVILEEGIAAHGITGMSFRRAGV